MSNHPMREFRDTLRHVNAKLADAGKAFGPVEIYPATPQERAADKLLRKAMARPVARIIPRRVIVAAVAWALLVIALAFGAGWFASKAVANAAATVTQLEQVQ